MSMWAPFTDDGRGSIVNAQEVAARYRCSYIDQEHLFLGCAQTQAVAGVFAQLGVSRQAIESAADRVLESGAQPNTQEMVFTPQAKRVIESAFAQARELQQQFIAPEHLVLGYIALGPAETAVLGALGVDAGDLRAALIEHVKTRRAPEPPSAGTARPELSFSKLFEKIAKRSPHRLGADLWPRLEAAVQARDLAGVAFYALSIAIRENLSAEDLFRDIESRFRDAE